MNNLTPEHEIGESRILKEYFRKWDKVLKIKGVPGDPLSSTITEYLFAIDRRQEEESLFTADRVRVNKLGTPLEEWTNTKPEKIETAAGEQWIVIGICPKDPYHPLLGIYSEQGYDWYYSELLSIFLSSHGRAYQQAEWNGVFKPDIHKDQRAYYSYLKKHPEPEEIQTRFDQEPEEVYTEPFQHLRGGSLERLDFLMSKLNRAKTIDVPYRAKTIDVPWFST